MTLEWSEQIEPEEGVEWRGQGANFVAEIRSYGRARAKLHVEFDVFNYPTARDQAWAIFRMMALNEVEVGK